MSNIPFRPGALLLKFRQKFGKGLRVAWYRDVFRLRILKSDPVTGLNDDTAEVHVLTSEQDWLNLIWTLKSFYAFADRPFRLAIHEDGSLSEKALGQLKWHFPDARFVLRRDADALSEKALSRYPKAAHFRKSYNLSLKIIDFPLHLESDRMILLDSDVLFFRRPDVLMDRILLTNYVLNTVNGDVEGALTVDARTAKDTFGFELLNRYNSGLGLLHRGVLRLEWIEEFLKIPGIMSHHWRIEQTLFALCSCRAGAELLPPEYDVYLTRGIGDRSSRHYVGAVRHLMYAEGMPRLIKDKVLSL